MAKKAPKTAAAKATAKKKPAKAVAPKKTATRAAKPAPKKAAEKPVSRAALGPHAYSDAELKKFKEMILSKRQETLEELDTLKETIMDTTTGEYVSESSNYSLHMEQGTDAMEREKTFLFASRSGKFVNQLDEALMRIENKSYGVCKACGLLVPKERLDAVPTATTCAEFKNTGIPCERGRAALARQKQSK
ncbi:RNA polymerase-binding transcription factor DksA [Planctomycetaceae bacterium]|nr:RNA polymerase-binding transcription factor DksA [Planctomycetaceae bacterium]